LPNDDVTPPVTKMYLAVLRAVEAMRRCFFSMITGYKSTGKKRQILRSEFKNLILEG